ncbi:hypothetical protein ACFQ1I_46375 [Kitasatospora arboriphila]
MVDTEHGLDVTVYRRKTKKHTVSAVLYGSDPATCPVRALQAYRQLLADAGRTDGPLLVRINRHGRIAAPMLRRGPPVGDPTGRLTPDACADVVERLADRAASPETGPATRCAAASPPPPASLDHDLVAIADAGGWDRGSKALLRYLDDVDRVARSPLIGIGL